MPLNFHPPLLNSANPWATTKSDLLALYDSPYTGAITTRTSTLSGFDEDESKHQYCFLDPQTHKPTHHSALHAIQHQQQEDKATPPSTCPPPQPQTSLNTYGYSPLPFAQYVDIITDILQTRSSPAHPSKPIIFSVTGPAPSIKQMHTALTSRLRTLSTTMNARFLLEINLSCPNIPNEPPPAYSADAIAEYISLLTPPDSNDASSSSSQEAQGLEIGIKLPPFTYQTQFSTFITALLSSSSQSQSQPCPLTFLTATNTLGSCLFPSPSLLSSPQSNTLSGLGGSALHSLALGNVLTLRRMLDAHETLKHVEIVGVGGVSDGEGYARMRSAGASAVAVGTQLGVEGLGVFERIWGECEGRGGGDGVRWKL